MPPMISVPSLPAICGDLLILSHFSCSRSSFGVASTTASPLERVILSCRAATTKPRFYSTPVQVRKRKKRNVPVSKAEFLQWMKTHGCDYEKHKQGVNYLNPIADDRQPYPSNPQFKSESVLSENTREMIYQRVFVEGEPIMVVSAHFGVDHRRVAAVVRMKQIEKQWQMEGKQLAKPYARAIMQMLPLHKFQDTGSPGFFEPINELHVHSYTMQQIFVPTSESRHFTREDAAEAFHPFMLSADARTPHKEYVAHLKRVNDGVEEELSMDKFRKEAMAAERANTKRYRDALERDKRLTTVVQGPRTEFRIKKMEADDVGLDGRSRAGVGWRYGLPFEDRKKGQMKHRTVID